jgi:hypothetical protein
MSKPTKPASCDRITRGGISQLSRSWEKKSLKECTQTH